jgi:hypothetical protein
MANTLYDTLEVIPSASQETIHAAYRSLISRNHPDKVAGLAPELQTLATTRTKEINHAYSVLRDATLRAAYDEQLRGSTNPSPRQQQPQSSNSPSPRAGFSRSDPRSRQVLAIWIAVLVGQLILYMALRSPSLAVRIVSIVVSGNYSDFLSLRKFMIPVYSSLSSDSFFSSIVILCFIFWFGLVSYRCGAAAGRMMATYSFGRADGEGFNCLNLLLWCFFIVAAADVLFFSNHIATGLLINFSILAGATAAKNRLARAC